MNRRQNPLTMGLLLLILAPAILTLIETGRDLYCDTVLIRTVTLKTELGHLRNSLIRRAGRLEHYLESDQFDEASDGPFLNLDRNSRDKLIAKLKLTSPSPTLETYWALTDQEGALVLHSLENKGEKGTRVTSTWDDDKQTDIGDDVVKVQQVALTGAGPAYDIFLPVQIQGQTIGTLHSGLDAASIDERIASEQRTFLLSRSWLVALLLIVNLTAIGGVIYLARQFAAYRAGLRQRDEEESRKLTKIGFGLAHEIRNPLHAIRLNTHTLRRSLAGKALSEQEIAEMLRECCDEIDRIESLMRSLVQYVSPQTTEAPTDIDLQRETQAILQLQGNELRRRNIAVRFDDEKTLLVVRMIPTRAKALLHELLTFSQRSAGEGGSVELQLRIFERCAELVLVDRGRPLSTRDLENLFEPFHATPYSEAGLALPLVRQYAIHAGGTLVRQQSPEGNRFLLRLPLA